MNWLGETTLGCIFQFMNWLIVSLPIPCQLIILIYKHCTLPDMHGWQTTNTLQSEELYTPTMPVTNFLNFLSRLLL